MNQQFRAIKKTAGMLAITVIIGFLIPVVLSTLMMLDTETIGWILLSTFFAFAVWIVYSINLTQIKHDDQITEMQQSHEQSVLNKQV